MRRGQPTIEGEDGEGWSIHGRTSDAVQARRCFIGTIRFEATASRPAAAIEDPAVIVVNRHQAHGREGRCSGEGGVVGEEGGGRRAPAHHPHLYVARA